MSRTSRQSFYPLPPSTYPKAIVDPCPALETTYGHEHGSHSIRDDEFYRSRTLHPCSSRAQTSPVTHQGLYPSHGIGQFVLPYYRRDSKGFRKTYTQPLEVDENYIRRTEWNRSARLFNTGVTWAHPSSRPTYNARVNTVGGATFGIGYRNSGLYDARSVPRSTKVPIAVYHANRGEHYPYLQGVSQPSNYLPSVVDGERSGFETVGMSQITPMDGVDQMTEEQFNATYGQQQSFAYTQQQQYEDSLDQTMRAQTTRLEQSQILNDPLLQDPIENAKRKAQTVYKRAYGLCA